MSEPMPEESTDMDPRLLRITALQLSNNVPADDIVHRMQNAETLINYINTGETHDPDNVPDPDRWLEPNVSTTDQSL